MNWQEILHPRGFHGRWVLGVGDRVHHDMGRQGRVVEVGAQGDPDRVRVQTDVGGVRRVWNVRNVRRDGARIRRAEGGLGGALPHGLNMRPMNEVRREVRGPIQNALGRAGHELAARAGVVEDHPAGGVRYLVEDAAGKRHVVRVKQVNGAPHGRVLSDRELGGHDVRPPVPEAPRAPFRAPPPPGTLPPSVMATPLLPAAPVDVAGVQGARPFAPPGSPEWMITGTITNVGQRIGGATGGNPAKIGDKRVFVKPQGNGNARPHIPANEVPREVAGYVIGQQLGVRVPRVIAREHNGELVSVQDWIPGARPYNAGRPLNKDDALRVAVFDSVMLNTDRHTANFVIGGDGRLWAIDNGLTLPTGPTVAQGAFVDHFAGERIPSELRAALVRMRGDTTAITAELENAGIESAAVQLMWNRVDLLLALGKIPRYQQLGATSWGEGAWPIQVAP